MNRQVSSTKVTVLTVQEEQPPRLSRFGAPSRSGAGPRPPTQQRSGGGGAGAPWWRDSVFVVLALAVFLAAAGMLFLFRLQRSFEADVAQEEAREPVIGWQE